MTTGQPYVYTGDDPLNSTDPLGLAAALNPQAWTSKSLPRVRNLQLKRILETLYQESDKLRGGTARALREEASTGKPTEGSFHELKGEQRLTQLKNLIQSGDVETRQDRLIARATYSDLYQAQSEWDRAAAHGTFNDALENGEGKFTSGRLSDAINRFEGSLIPSTPDDDAAFPNFGQDSGTPGVAGDGDAPGEAPPEIELP